MPTRSQTILDARRLAPPSRWLGFLADLGAIAILGCAAARSAIRPRRAQPALAGAVSRNMADLLATSLGIVILVHIPFGSFLAMQAYFGATFTEAAGAVVGLGFVRNVGPILTGLAMAGLLAGRIVPELSAESHLGLDDPPGYVPDREVAAGQRLDPRTPPEPARLALVRILAALLAGPILTFWGSLAGIALGGLIAGSVLGVSADVYYGRFFEMVQLRDAVGLVVKGAAYPALAALVACSEGLRQSRRNPFPSRAVRAATMSIVFILILNFSWFNLAYMTGSPYGPALVGETGP